MKSHSLAVQIFAEFVGSLLLVATVVGSGIMATNLSADIGVQLLINMIATVFMLVILISTLQPISGAHFNPAVSLIEYFQNRINLNQGLLYVLAQLSGAISGTALAHIMFAQEIISTSSKVRDGSNLFVSELVATAGLILVINLLVQQQRINQLPYLVGFWIGAGYLFTASTSFANPTVTIARGFTDSFSGISPDSIPLFIAAQFIGAVVGFLIFKLLVSGRERV